MISLFKALTLIGFEHVAPRTLQRGQVTIILRYGKSSLHWEIYTPFGYATYRNQKEVLHGLVLRLVIGKEELEFLSSLGLEYAKEELLNYEKTLKRIEAGGQKAIRNYIKSIEETKEADNSDIKLMNRIHKQFVRQVVYPVLENQLKENNNRCPICGKLILSVEEFYSHLLRTPIREIEHKQFIKRINDELTNAIP